MRAMCFSLIVFCLGLTAVRGSSASPSFKTIRVNGQEYVGVEAWAETKQFRWQWLKKGEELLLMNRWGKLVFDVDSRRAEINGIVVWLSFAVAGREGKAYFARRDVQTVIEPVLFPAKSRRPDRIRTIVIDPGHGGKDPGNLDGISQEKRYTLLLANELRQMLQKIPIKVGLTRAADKAVDLDLRPALARQMQADLFISLHYNAAPGPKNSVRGVEMYCLTPAGAASTNGRGETDSRAYPGNRFDPKNILLAYQLQKSLVNSLGVEDRGIKRARWAVLRSAEMPAVLIEGGFMTDSSDANRIYSPAHRRQFAQAVVDGLLAYKRMVER